MNYCNLKFSSHRLAEQRETYSPKKNMLIFIVSIYFLSYLQFFKAAQVTTWRKYGKLVLQPWTKYTGTFGYFLHFPLFPNLNVAPGWKSVPFETTSLSATLKNGKRGLLLKKIGIYSKITKIFKSPKYNDRGCRSFLFVKKQTEIIFSLSYTIFSIGNTARRVKWSLQIEIEIQNISKI